MTESPIGREPEEEVQPPLSFHSEGHRKISETLSLLARTARSFTLYDVDNDAIRSFLERLLTSFDEVLAGDPEIALEIGLFDMKWRSELVYNDRDWERSLAFRLYRDGVRAIGIRRGFGWEELAKLLELLSIRYIGVNQTEEDLVTLLWKAGFENLSVVSVQGFEPEDRDEMRREMPGRKGDLTLPDDVDMPFGAAPAPRPPEWVEVPQDTAVILRDLVSSEALPDDCLRLAAVLEQALQEALEPMVMKEVEHVFAELRDYFASEGRLAPLLVLTRRIRDLYDRPMPSWDPQRKHAVARLLFTFADPKVVRKMIVNVPDETYVLPGEVITILDLCCHDPLTLSYDLLELERAATPRMLIRQLLEHYGRERVEWLREKYGQAKGDVASDLLRVMSRLPGERNEAFFALQAAHPERSAREEAIHFLERTPYKSAIGRWIFDAFRKADEVHRKRLLAIMERSADVRFADMLSEYLLEKADRMDPDEGAIIGRVMGLLGGESIVERCDGWLRTSGLLRKSLSGPLARQAAAVSALAEVPCDDSNDILLDTDKAASPELRPYVQQARSRLSLRWRR